LGGIFAGMLAIAPTVIRAETPERDRPSGTAQSSPAAMKRRSPLTEKELLEQLRREAVPVDIQAVGGLPHQIVEAARAQKRARQASNKRDKTPAPEFGSTLRLLKERPEFNGLPLREEPECRKPELDASQMQQVSQSVQAALVQFNVGTGGLVVHHDNENILLAPLARMSVLYSKPNVRTLLQMFQPQGPAVRLKLVEQVAAWEDPQASMILAQRAMFDFSATVRAAAVQALGKRPRAEFRQVLLDGLRYPWPPVADHAAEALTALRDRDALENLVALLDRPDPREPFPNEKKERVVPELVAINHLRNCLLCHPPSLAATDTARGRVPVPGESLGPRYYESNDPTVIFARADVTYLQQDFSVFQPVNAAAPWPDEQRFDYLIRQRVLSPDEEGSTSSKATYPQREAVLFALRELTGEDRCERTGDWQKLLPKPAGLAAKK
jgi:hypothetical protein